MRETECFSMYSDISSRIMARSSSNKNSARARANSVLPTPVGPRKMNEPMGRFGIGEARAIAANGVGDALEGVFLSDDALAQPLLHGDQLSGLAFEQAADGNAGPFADQRGDVFFVDLFLQHAAIFLDFGQALLRLFKLAFCLR